MSSRPLSLSILIFITILIAIYAINLKLQSSHSIYRISSGLKWIGVIDLDSDHCIDFTGIAKGEDALLLVDYYNPLIQPILQNKALNLLEIADFDSDNDGVLNEQDPIFRLLRIIIFNPYGQGYEVKTLDRAGIRGIRVKHIAQNSNHQAVLSDGSERTLYEINQGNGTSLFRTVKGNEVIEIEETQ
jgi:hypothetical protein